MRDWFPSLPIPWRAFIIFAASYLLKTKCLVEGSLLAEHPQDVLGLSLPGMPSGVPGMEGPRDSSLAVYAIKKDGTTTTYATQ